MAALCLVFLFFLIGTVKTLLKPLFGLITILAAPYFYVKRLFNFDGLTTSALNDINASCLYNYGIATLEFSSWQT